jgi:hypothetical protein
MSSWPSFRPLTLVAIDEKAGRARIGMRRHIGVGYDAHC